MPARGSGDRSSTARSSRSARTRCGRATCWRALRVAGGAAAVAHRRRGRSAGELRQSAPIIAASSPRAWTRRDASTCSRTRRSPPRGPRNGRARRSRSITSCPADALVAEVNQGGEMVRAVLNEADPSAPVTMARATRGKYLRAAPVAQLYEQGRVRHVGAFPALEDEMCDFGARRTFVRPLPRPARRAGLGDHGAGADAARRPSRACGGCETRRSLLLRDGRFEPRQHEELFASARLARPHPEERAKLASRRTRPSSRRFPLRILSCPHFSRASSARSRPRAKRKPRARRSCSPCMRIGQPQWTRAQSRGADARRL